MPSKDILRKYTVYDFDRPDKFSFDHLKSLDSIFSVFSRNFSTDLSGYLRLPVEIEVEKVEQIPFNSEYLEKKERDVNVFCITEFNKEQFLIQFDVGFILRAHTKLLGGEFGEIKPVRKNITEYEKMTVEEMLKKYFYPNLQEAFKGIEEVKFSVQEIETDPQYARVTLPQDMVALVTLSVRIGNQYTQIVVVLPYLSIENVIDKLNSDNVLKNKEFPTSEEQLAYIYEQVLQIERNFIVNLGIKNLSLKEISELEVGDTIILDPIEEEVECTVGRKTKFKGKIGRVDGKKAVKITSTVKEKLNEEEKIQKAQIIKSFLEEKQKEGGKKFG